MTQIREFIEWMSFHPGMEDIPRALANDYLAEFGVKGVRFFLHSSDDSLLLLGQFGYSDAMAWRNRSTPSEEWRAIKSEEIQLIVSAFGQKWTNDSKFYVSTLRNHGVIQGYLIVEFTNPVTREKKERAAEAIDDLSMPIALYLSFQNRRTPYQANSINNLDATRESVGGKLSARQIAILRGMVEGKTNHELATELGFSVSTVRHETMRIYHALAVSDRKEAAKKALMLSII
jgi:DNA-binding CsgD family transcriptional regulator